MSAAENINEPSRRVVNVMEDAPQHVPYLKGADYLPPLVRSFVVLFRLRGKRISGERMITALGNSGPSVEACRRAAAELGLTSSLLHRPTLADINPLALPCLLLLQNEKSCALLELREDRAKIILPDNPQQEVWVSTEALGRHYSGYALFGSLTPEADKQLKPMDAAEERNWFWDVVKHFLPLYSQVAVASIMTNLLVLVGPLFVMNVYDRVVPNVALETLWVLALGAFLGYLLEMSLKILRGYFTEKASSNIDTIVSTRIMRHILGMKLEDRPASSGALMSHMREFDSLREFCSASTLLTFADIPFLIIFLGVISMLGGNLVFVPLGAMVVLLTLVLLMQKAAARNARVQHYGSVEKSSHLVEMVTGLEAIKMASAETRMLHIWEKISGHCAKSNEDGKRLSSNVANLSMFLTQLVSVALIVFGVYLIGDNKLTVGGLVACNILTGRIMSAMVQVASLITRYQQAKLSMKNLRIFMELPQESERPMANVDFGHLEHSLEFTHVSYTYPEAHLPAIRDLHFSIPAGMRLAVLGAMGSGKSTLCKLMVGLYEPGEGSVRFGGVDLRQLDVVELRTRIGYMPQEPVLFHGTVRDNIALGSPNVPDALVLRAAYLAGVTDFIKQHPSGFGMEVGERGSNLSGGQRQAISLARALLYDPDVIILDEPTSNMDRFTEEVIKKRLVSTLEGKTLIINMHRTSLLSLVDHILVLNRGQMQLYGPRDSVLRYLNKQQAK